MNFEDQLTAAMRSTANAVAPPVADLVAGGVQRGRDMRHRQTVRRTVLAGAGVLTAGAVSVACWWLPAAAAHRGSLPAQPRLRRRHGRLSPLTFAPWSGQTRPSRWRSTT